MHEFPPDVLPLRVADADFPSPEPVIRALRERVEHGVFGYGVEQPEFHEVMCDRLLKRFGWDVPIAALDPEIEARTGAGADGPRPRAAPRGGP